MTAPLKDRAGQAQDLAKALRIISEAYPFDLDTRQGAHSVVLQSSDQAYGYGFHLHVIKDGNNFEIDDEAVIDEINDLLCDLDWNGVVGEDKRGYAWIAVAQAETYVDPRLGLDTESSTSRQHYVDTGRYLYPDEVIEVAPVNTERPSEPVTLLGLAILALNTVHDPEATEQQDVDYLIEHTDEVIAFLDDLRKTYSTIASAADDPV